MFYTLISTSTPLGNSSFISASTVFALLGGLVFFKSVIITGLGPYFGLTYPESIRTGLLLSGGGEFAFVILTLGDKLNVLPGQLTKILVGVVVLSMAITPYLANLGDILANYYELWEQNKLQGVIPDMGKKVDYEKSTPSNVKKYVNEDNILENETDSSSKQDFIVICGYGSVGETVVKFLSSEIYYDAGENALNNEIDDVAGKTVANYVAFDLDPSVVIDAFRAGKNVLYGDASNPMVLSTAGFSKPKAFIVTYQDDELCIRAVERLRQAFPSVPITSRVSNVDEYIHLFKKGADIILLDSQETSLKLGEKILQDLGVKED